MVPHPIRKNVISNWNNASKWQVLHLVDEVADDVEHVPLVPGLGLLVPVTVSAVSVAVLGLFEGVAYDECVQRRVAQRVRLVDEFAQAVVEQQLCSLQRVLGRLLAKQKEHVQHRHLLRGRPHRRLRSARHQQFHETSVV